MLKKISSSKIERGSWLRRGRGGELGLRTFAKKSAKGSAAAAQKKGFVSTTTTTRLTSSARAGGGTREHEGLC